MGVFLFMFMCLCVCVHEHVHDAGATAAPASACVAAPWICHLEPGRLPQLLPAAIQSNPALSFPLALPPPAPSVPVPSRMQRLPASLHKPPGRRRARAHGMPGVPKAHRADGRQRCAHRHSGGCERVEGGEGAQGVCVYRKDHHLHEPVQHGCQQPCPTYLPAAPQPHTPPTHAHAYPLWLCTPVRPASTCRRQNRRQKIPDGLALQPFA